MIRENIHYGQKRNKRTEIPIAELSMQTAEGPLILLYKLSTQKVEVKQNIEPRPTTEEKARQLYANLQKVPTQHVSLVCLLGWDPTRQTVN